MPAKNLGQALRREAEAAKTLIEHLKALGITEDDEDIISSSIEGETSLQEVIGEAIKAIREDEAAINALKQLEEEYGSRRERLANRIGTARAAIINALEIAGQKRMPTSFGTATLSSGKQKVIIYEEADIPSRFFVPQPPPPPKLDKKAIEAALLANENVPGARLSNGSPILSIY